MRCVSRRGSRCLPVCVSVSLRLSVSPCFCVSQCLCVSQFVCVTVSLCVFQCLCISVSVSPSASQRTLCQPLHLSRSLTPSHTLLHPSHILLKAWDDLCANQGLVLHCVGAKGLASERFVGKVKPFKDSCTNIQYVARGIYSTLRNDILHAVTLCNLTIWDLTPDTLTHTVTSQPCNCGGVLSMLPVTVQTPIKKGRSVYAFNCEGEGRRHEHG